MITIEETEVSGLEAAVRAMRNPMNSWISSDSVWSDDYDYASERTKEVYVIGQKDSELMSKLARLGTDHAKCMRMIIVTCDITAPLFWWKQFDTYKVGTVRCSCSTMHRIHAEEFSESDFTIEHLSGEGLLWLQKTIDVLNRARRTYTETKNKIFWEDMVNLLPSCYNQKSTVMLNYQVLRNMYHARKNHKLGEWHDFCKWVESLPHSEWITEA